jgi:hypothetical protein
LLVAETEGLIATSRGFETQGREDEDPSQFCDAADARHFDNSILGLRAGRAG